MADIHIAPEISTEPVEPTQFAEPDDGFIQPIRQSKQTAKEILSHTDKDERSAMATIAAYVNKRYGDDIDDVLLNYDAISNHYKFTGDPMADVESIRAGEHDIENRMTSMSLNPDAIKQYEPDTSSTWSDFKNSLDVGFLSDSVGAPLQGAAKGFEMWKDPFAGMEGFNGTGAKPSSNIKFFTDRDTGKVTMTYGQGADMKEVADLEAKVRKMEADRGNDFDLSVQQEEVPVDDSWVSSEGVRQWREEVEARNPISPEFAESFGGQVTRAFGQAGGMPVYMVAAPIGMGMSIAQAYQFGEDNYREYTEANDIPFDELEARRAGLWNMPNASLDIINNKFVVGKILRKAGGKSWSPNKLYKFGRDLIQSGAMGGVTEGSQEMWENFNAKYLSGYNPDAKITEGAWTAFKIGFIVDSGSTAGGKTVKSAVDKSLDTWFHPLRGMSPQDMGAAFSTVTDEEFEKWNKKLFKNRKDENGTPLQDLAREARQGDRAAAEALSKSQTEEKAEDDADGVTEAERKAADEKDERETEGEEYADPFEEISQEDAAIQSKRDAIETAKVFIDENPELEVVKSGNMAKIIARFESEIAEIEAQVAAESKVKAETAAKPTAPTGLDEVGKPLADRYKKGQESHAKRTDPNGRDSIAKAIRKNVGDQAAEAYLQGYNDAQEVAVSDRVAAKAKKVATDPNARPEDVQAAQAADEATREKADVVAAIADYLSQTFLPGSEMENAPGTIRSFQADLNTMLRSGMPKAAVQRFAENAIKAAGLPAGTDPRRLTIDGVQQSKVKRDGTYVSKIKLFQTADPLTVFEEVAHDYTDRKVAEKVYDYVDHYRPWVDLIDGEGASKDMTDREVKERLADFAKAYAITKSKDIDAKMPTSFRTWLNGVLLEIRKYLEIAAKIRTLRRNGMLDAEFEAFLERSMGLDDAELQRYENAAQQAEIAPDPKTELKWYLKGNAVPRPDSDPTFRAELETYFKNIGVQWKYRRKGGSLDDLTSFLKAEGFPVDTIGETIDLLDRSARGEEIFAAVNSRSAAQQTADESFSLSPAEKAAGVDANRAVSATVYERNSQKFKAKIDDGTIRPQTPIGKFNGMDMYFHAPDFAFAGTASVEGEKYVEGKGGVYYPVVFSDGVNFWASTKDAAIGMAESLNRIGERNGGKILMGLVSSPADKMFSSTTISRGVVDFFNVTAKNPRKYGIKKSDLNRMIVASAKVARDKEKTFIRKLKVGSGLDENVKEIKDLLNPNDSTFGLRKSFVENLTSSVASHLNLQESSKSAAMSGALLGADNMHAKGNIKGGKLSKASIMQGLGEQLSENFTKGLHESGSGMVYTVIEYDGKVDAVKTTQHESYPYAIRGVDGGKVVVNVLDRAYKWNEVVEYSEDVEFMDDKKNVTSTASAGDSIRSEEVGRVMPASAGVTFKPLRVKAPSANTESVAIPSYSLSPAPTGKVIKSDVIGSEESLVQSGYTYSHRRKDGLHPSETGHVIQLVDDFSQNKHYGDENYLVKGDDISELPQFVYDEALVWLQGNVSKTANENHAMNMVNPYNIEDGAGIWDEPDFIALLKSKYPDELNDVAGFKLADGAIIISPEKVSFGVTTETRPSFSLSPAEQTSSAIIALAKEIDGDAFSEKVKSNMAFVESERSKGMPYSLEMEADQITLAAESVLLDNTDDPRAVKMLEGYGENQFDKYFDGSFSLSPAPETAEFKSWFGDSKVVDENGEPLVVFHGTSSVGIDIFDGHTGVAAHFAFDPDYAEDYAEGDFQSAMESGADVEFGNAPTVYQVYLKAENVFDARLEAHRKLVGLPKVYDYMSLEAAQHDIKAAGFDSYYDFENMDGVLTGIAVFDPTQIKSATDNRGTFDPADPRISFSLSEIDAEAEAQAEAEKARKERDHRTPTEQKYEKAQADFDANPDEQSDKAFEALILLKEKARKSREVYDLRKSYEDKKKAPAMKKVDKILSDRKTFEDVRGTLRKLEEVVRGLHPNLRTRFRGFESPAGYNMNEADRIKFLERQKQRVQDVFDREKYYSDRRAARKRWQSWNKNIDEARAGRKKLNVSNGEAVSKFIKEHLPLTPEAREVIEDRIDAINDDIFQTLNGVTVGDEKAVIAARAKVAESQTELEGLQQRLGRAKFWSNKVGASQIEMFERDLQSLIKTGRTEFEIRKEKQQAQVKSEATAIKAEIQAAIKSGKDLNQALAEALGKRAEEGFNTIKTKGRLRAELEKFITAHLRPETQMDLMTGEADNALIEFIFNRMADAEYAYQAAMQANSDIIKDEVVGDASFDPKQILMAGTSLTADRAMAIYAYSQSAAGRAHLKTTLFEGVLLTDDVVDQLLKSLPAELKAVVDRAMIFLDTTIYPKINQTFLGQFGVELPRSDNYFPIQGLDRDTSIEDILNDYGHARAVGRGMTKGRVKSELPFENLNFTETFFNAVSRGERYANMSDAHAQARSTMEYKDITREENGDVKSVNWEMQKVMKTRSDAMTASLNGWVARVALGRAAPSDTGFLAVLGKLRRNLATGWLAYNPKTVITQTLSVSPAIGMATDKAEMVAYLAKYGSSIKEATEAADFANRNSPMMDTRGDNISTALTELMETQAVARAFDIESRFSDIKEKGFIPMQKFDKYLSVGIWMGEYKSVSNRALAEGKSPDEAHSAGVAAGDKIVRTTQSTADVINSAEIMMSSNQILRTFVMFRTDINQTMNNMISDFQLSKTGKEKVKSISNSAAWMVLFPAIMLASIAALAEETAELLKLKDDDDDKGEDLENWAKSIASESVGQTVGSLIFVGDIVKGAADKAVDSDKAMFANDINSPVMAVAGDLASLDRRSFKAMLLLSGVPLSKYIADADEIIERWWNALK